MEDEANRDEPVRDNSPETGANPSCDLLTVSQAYAYLIAEGLPRSKKTIRKWCRLNHVEWKEIAVPGGAKWLITRSSLDARIAEEKQIEASLVHETGAHPSGPVRTENGADRSERVRDPLVGVLKEQLAYERQSRVAAEAKSRDLIDKYHEISLALARMGIEVGKGLQAQAQARRIAVRTETDSSEPVGHRAEPRILETKSFGTSDTQPSGDAGDNDPEVDNLASENAHAPLQ